MYRTRPRLRVPHTSSFACTAHVLVCAAYALMNITGIKRDV
jgi:hypothetical protein